LIALRGQLSTRAEAAVGLEMSKEMKALHFQF
jgi:hypothetical protein